MKVDTFTLMRGLRNAQLPVTAKAVGWAIGLRSGTERACFASVETLGKDAGLKPTATAKAVKRLVDEGLLLRRDRPGTTSLLELNAAPLVALVKQEAADKRARDLERGQIEPLPPDNAEPHREADHPPAQSGKHSNGKRGKPPRIPSHSPSQSGDEIPNQIPKEIQRGNTTTKADSAAVASLIDFGMNRKTAVEVAGQMVPGEAERAISWAKSEDKGAGLIVTCIRNGQRPWNRDTVDLARRAAEVEATLDRLGIK